jgi:CTP:molybdopterin cytidylyltransferase MocA
MSTIGVILAAGGGTRYVGPTHKLLARFQGGTVIGLVINALMVAGLDEVAIVTGAVDLGSEIPSGLQVIENEDWANGQATSLAHAVDFAERRGHGAVVIGLGDQPLVPSSAWQAVASCTLSPIVTASFGGQRRPPVRLDAEVWPLLPRIGDEGARGVMATHPEFVTVIACEGGALDIDTVEDLQTPN